MRPFHQLPIVLLAALLGASLARDARAGDKEEARSLFERGIEQMEAKNYEEACPAIERSLKLDPFPGTLFALAECESLRGKAVAAYKRYGEYLDLYATLPKDKQQKQGTREKDARAKRADLEKVFATVTLVLPPNAPADTMVTQDGVTLLGSEVGAPTRLDPGDHVVTTKAPDGPVTEQKFTLAKGERREIKLEVKLGASKDTPPPRPRDQGTSGRRIAAYAAGGVGAAGLVLGSITGGLMLAQADAINSGCENRQGGRSFCDAKGVSAGNDAKTFGAIASAGWVTAIVGVGVAVVLIVTEPPRRKAPTAEKGSIEMGIRPLAAGGATGFVGGTF